MNHLSQEFIELKRAIVSSVAALFLVFAGLLSLSLEEKMLFGATIPIPVFGTPTLATQIFLSAKDTLVPAGIPVVALGPVSAFVAPITMALLVALLITFPFMLYRFTCFLRPALHAAERRTLSLFIIPSLALFYLGCALGYFIIIPQTFSILYSFAEPMGVAPIFALDDFIASVFTLTISVGVAFLLPVFMTLFSCIGLIPGAFWARHWRGAVLATIIFSAVITPDGSGITMVFLSGPLLGLYMIGALAATPRSTSLM